MDFRLCNFSRAEPGWWVWLELGVGNRGEGVAPHLPPPFLFRILLHRMGLNDAIVNTLKKKNSLFVE